MASPYFSTSRSLGERERLEREELARQERRRFGIKVDPPSAGATLNVATARRPRRWTAAATDRCAASPVRRAARLLGIDHKRARSLLNRCARARRQGMPISFDGWRVLLSQTR